MRVSTFFLLIGVTAASAASAPKSNPQIAGVVKEISARNIETSIRKLVSFGTRHTLSDTTSGGNRRGASLVENDSAARELGRFIKSTGERYVPGMTVNIIYRKDRYLRGGDHSPFLEAGFPAVRMTEPNEDYRHQHQNVRQESGVQYGDLPEFDDFAYIAQVARINAASLGALALAPAAPAGVEMETKELTNDTTLRWEANREPDLTGYEVFWRETTAPLWQHSVSAGRLTCFTLPRVSKDNFLFGVAAVDQDGNRSSAGCPAPSAK